jgi:hypothetical protein
MRILITGSRQWTDRDAIEAAILEQVSLKLVENGNVTIVHGGAVGADVIAKDVARTYRMKQEEHLPKYAERYGGLAGLSAPLVRNDLMVSLGADVCLAFTVDDRWSGTRYTMKKAKEAGIPVIETSDRRRQDGDPAKEEVRP